MMMLAAGIIGATGLACIISRRTLLGLLIGVQLLVLGATTIFVLAGIASGSRIEGHVAGLMIALGGLGQLAAGYALTIRLFYLKEKIQMDELRSLKH